MMLRQEKVGSGKLSLSITPGGECSDGPGANAGSGPEIPPREGRDTHNSSLGPPVGETGI